jgi:hypothetical protein
VNREPSIRLIPDGRRTRQLVAKGLRKSEAEVQGMAESQDSLDGVELVVAVEEVLGLGLRDDDG